MALETDSLDSHSKIKRPLTLEIPSNSQISLVESSSVPQTTRSSSSLLPTLSVKFAPLPQLSPRKRRSTIPLGMAGRGQLVPRRRGRKTSPLWTDEGPEEYRLQQEELAAQDARTSAYAAYAAARKEEEEDELESDYDWRRKNGEQVDEGDPLHALGRIVKGASKTLWKRVSNKDMATAAVGASTSIPKRREGSNSGSSTLTKTFPPSPPRSILGTITSNTGDHHIEEEEEEEGGVWEEEIGSTFLHHVSQTETIVEGRVYSHFTSKVEALTRSPPPSPSVSSSKRMSSFTRPPSLKKIPPPFKAKQAS